MRFCSENNFSLHVGSDVGHETMGLKVFSCMHADKQGLYTNDI